MMSQGTRPAGVLTYGAVELHLFDSYAPGEIILIAPHTYLEVVDRVEKADGIVILATHPRPGQRWPGCTCVLFTHYQRHAFLDIVDHAATVTHLSLPTEHLRRATEIAFTRDLIRRSIAASFAYTPQVRYL